MPRKHGCQPPRRQQQSVVRHSADIARAAQRSQRDTPELEKVMATSHLQFFTAHEVSRLARPRHTRILGSRHKVGEKCNELPRHCRLNLDAGRERQRLLFTRVLLVISYSRPPRRRRRLLLHHHHPVSSPAATLVFPCRGARQRLPPRLLPPDSPLRAPVSRGIESRRTFGRSDACDGSANASALGAPESSSPGRAKRRACPRPRRR